MIADTKEYQEELNNTNIELEIRDKTTEIAALLIRKNRDYKGASFDLGTIGNGIHLWDKIKRYRNMVLSGTKPNYETATETLQDIAGYAILGLIIADIESEASERLNNATK